MKGDKKLHNTILVRKPSSVSYPMALFVATGVEPLDSTDYRTASYINPNPNRHT
jgi:hypothetical protein